MFLSGRPKEFKNGVGQEKDGSKKDALETKRGKSVRIAMGHRNSPVVSVHMCMCIFGEEKCATPKHRDRQGLFLEQGLGRRLTSKSL